MDILEQLYEKYSLPLYRFLLSLTGSAQDAEELLQETFYQALKGIDRFEGRCSSYTWLCQIGKNIWCKELNKRKRFYKQPIEEMELSKEERLLEQMVKQEERQHLRKAVWNLKEPYREIVMLHIYGENSLKEIAVSFGKSESWARVTFYRAKQMLIEQMRREETE